MSSQKGCIQVYTGSGKGKTTASLGLGLRAHGNGMKVYMIQFMKGRRYSEMDSIDLLPNFTIVQHGRDEFVSKESPERIDIDLARAGFEHAKEIVARGEHGLVILDEINVAVDFGLIPLGEVLDLIGARPDHMELVLTGRSAHPEIVKAADLVTEMLEIKHPYQVGVQARKGIEF